LLDVPPDEADGVRLALLLVCVNFAFSLPASLFDAILQAYQRYDIRNGTDIITVLARTALTFWLIGIGNGLITLALLTLLCSLAGTMVRAVVVFRLDRSLRM